MTLAAVIVIAAPQYCKTLPWAIYFGSGSGNLAWPAFLPFPFPSILFPRPYSTSGIVALCFYLAYSPLCFCPLAHDASIPPPSACSLIRSSALPLRASFLSPPPTHSLISIRLTNNFCRSCFSCQHLRLYKFQCEKSLSTHPQKTFLFFFPLHFSQQY